MNVTFFLLTLSSQIYAVGLIDDRGQYMLLSAFQHESPGESDFLYHEQIAARVMQKLVDIVGQDRLVDLVGSIRRIISDCSTDQLAIDRVLIDKFREIDPFAEIEIVRCFMHR